jgi:hypothetical protein
MSPTAYVYQQEGYIIHAALYGMFSMHLFQKSASFIQEDCLHKRMENKPYKVKQTQQCFVQDMCVQYTQ